MRVVYIPSQDVSKLHCSVLSLYMPMVCTIEHIAQGCISHNWFPLLSETLFILYMLIRKNKLNDYSRKELALTIQRHHVMHKFTDLRHVIYFTKMQFPSMQGTVISSFFRPYHVLKTTQEYVRAVISLTERRLVSYHYPLTPLLWLVTWSAVMSKKLSYLSCWLFKSHLNPSGFFV